MATVDGPLCQHPFPTATATPSNTDPSDLIFSTAVLVPSQQELQLQTVVLAVAAFPARAGSQLIKALGAAAPLPNLRHLKRVRKPAYDSAVLEAILCALPDDSAHAAALGAAAAHHAAGDAATATATATQAPNGECGQQAEGQDAALPGIDLSPDALPPALRELYGKHGGLRLRALTGSAAPPQTRAQWEAWTALWPITWRIPDHGTPVTEEVPVDAPTQAYFEHHMRAAFALAAAAGASNAALLAAPPCRTALAAAADGSSRHPLHHAVMCAVQAASERDLALWPVGGVSGEGGESRESNDGEARTQAASCQGGELAAGGGGGGASRDGGMRPQGGTADAGAGGELRSGGSGREESTRGGEGSGPEEEDALAAKRPRLGTDPWDTPAGNPTLTTHDGPANTTATTSAPASPGLRAGANAAPGSRPYMCTGHDCFVVLEPCIMCAMALVHSRVQRVVYCVPDASYGALGGCRRLHACRSLNHNYEVYRMELRQGGSERGS